MNFIFEFDQIKIQMCNHCGKDVSLGSGLFVNRVPDFNDLQTRIDNGLKFPLGDFVCWKCDQDSENDYD